VSDPSSTSEAFVPVEFAVTTRSGLELRAEGWGDPACRPVVLVHGGGQTRHSWGGTAAAVAAGGRYAIAYDQRGHGGSDRATDQDYSAARFAEDCVDVCTAVAGRHDGTGSAPAVVGASLGGLSALVAEGLLQPGCTSAVVLVDVTPRMESVGVDRIIGFMVDRLESGFESLDDAADAISAYQPHRSRPTDLTGLSKNLRRGGDGRWRWHWDPAMILGPSPLGTGSESATFARAARQLTVPTLLIRGRMSDLVSEQTAQEFLELQPAARFVDVSGAGHMVAGDRNDAFTDAVVEFLRTLS